MLAPVTYREDMHVHSTWSDGKHTVRENVAEAIERRLTRLCCVDHVRRDTAWVPDFVRDIEIVRTENVGLIDVLCGVEAKLLDADGTLDAPDDLHGVDYVFVADHQVPWGRGCLRPQDVRRMLQLEQIDRRRVIETLVEATARAVERTHRVVVAHLFSVLPKLHVSEDEVPTALVDELARVLAAHDAAIEIDERWSCPSPRVVSRFLREGVRVHLSTDSHRKDDIGRYRYAVSTLKEAGLLARVPSLTERPSLIDERPDHG